MYDEYDLIFIELLKQMTEEERAIILLALRASGSDNGQNL